MHNPATQATPATVSEAQLDELQSRVDRQGEWGLHVAEINRLIATARAYHRLREAAERAVTARERYRYLGSRPMPESALASGDGMAALAEFLSVENGFVAEMDALRDLLGIEKAAALLPDEEAK